MLTRSVLPVLNLAYNNVFNSLLTAIHTTTTSFQFEFSLISISVWFWFSSYFRLIRSLNISSLSRQKVVSLFISRKVIRPYKGREVLNVLISLLNKILVRMYFLSLRNATFCWGDRAIKIGNSCIEFKKQKASLC